MIHSVYGRIPRLCLGLLHIFGHYFPNSVPTNSAHSWYSLYTPFRDTIDIKVALSSRLATHFVIHLYLCLSVGVWLHSKLIVQVSYPIRTPDGTFCALFQSKLFNQIRTIRGSNTSQNLQTIYLFKYICWYFYIHMHII